MNCLSALSIRICLIAFAQLPWAIAQECRLAALSPAQPALKIEEGERALESQTFQANVFTLSPSNVVHFVDSTNRIRRIESSGRLTTVAGGGDPSSLLASGPALQTSLASVTQIAFSPSGVLHFTASGRIYRVVDGTLGVAAGSGRPGFNGESGRATEVSLGSIVNIAFSNSGSLLILDGFNRIRRLDDDGTVRTIAGSTRAAATTGSTGDNGPATQAALSSPRQIVPLRDGSIWIKDLSGRQLRVLTPDGIIHTLTSNFDTSVNILLLADGTPVAATDNRVYPLRTTGLIETGANPFPPFTGTPIAIGSDGALFFRGSARPEQRNPLVRLASGVQTVIAGAPVPPTVDGQAPPFGIWNPRTKSLLYSASQGGKSGILEARAGQAVRFVVGGGDDVGEADGKSATSLATYGVLAFSLDGDGRIIVADVNRRRILVVAADGKVAVLKTQAGDPIVYGPLGSLSTLQRIAADNAGNIYWFAQGATPTGGVFTADINLWTRSSSSVTTFTVSGLSALARLEDGSVAAIAGNGGNFRTAYRVGPSGQGDPVYGLRMLPLVSVSRSLEKPYFTAASRLFRGDPGRLEYLDVQAISPGGASSPDFVLASDDNVLVHLNDGGFYRIDNVDACNWTPQPLISAGGVVNAASYEFPNSVSPRELMTVFGSGFGPPEGQGLVLDGVLRATAQPAPYPALTLGNFSGTIPNATLTGTALPVVYSNDSQITLQAVSGTPASGEYLLYFSWQGLQLIYPVPIKVRTATPGLFTGGFGKDGVAAALNQDGTRNSTSNPAAAGSVVQLFGTGFGTLDTNPATGDFLSVTARTGLTNAVSATIGGQPAEVQFAGGAPGTIAGVNQVNLRVPGGLSAGSQTVLMEVAGQPSQQVTIQVK
jgi:uncharacterized protein (TIGR03437 family)